MASSFSIFISYVSEDETIANLIKEFLEKNFLSAQVFVAVRDLKAGQIWIERIRDSLKNSHAIVPIITQFSEESPWVLFEAGAGFTDSRTIPLCADAITLDTLKPPLKLLQAIELSNEGLTRLAGDIAKRAELREPQELHGLSNTLNSIEQFLRTREHRLQTEINEKVRTEQESEIDLEIQSRVTELINRRREVVIRIIDKARNSYNVPSRSEMEKMDISELTAILKFHKLPAPNLVFLTHLLNLKSNPIKKNASDWEKINAKKEIDIAFEELTKLENDI